VAKYRRQPKAGELSGRGSPRFAERPREVFASRPMEPAKLATEREPTVYPAHITIKVLPEGAARYSNVWRVKGGMMGGATGCTRGVTSCPVIARAHIGRRG
jgi:hypothetical protein